MTDKEIIKALECCIDCKCKECPCYNKETDGCKEIDEQDILNLINRQKSEIERLQDFNENLQTANTALSNEILEIKSEAIKEFAHLVIERSSNGVIQISDIPDIVKEMGEENK